MHVRHGLAGLAALTAATAAAVEAGQGREPWEQVGEWQVKPDYPGRCSAARQYPSGTLVFVSSQNSGSAGLLVHNRLWSKRNSATHRIRLLQGGTPQSLAAEVESGFIGLHLSTQAGSGLLAQLSGGGSLEVTAPDGAALESIDLGGLAAALERLGPCLSEAAVAANFPPVAAPPPPPPPSRRGKVRPARQQTSLHLLFSSDDYPASAARAGEEGAVGFRLDIGKEGRVAACTVTRSSGSSALDATTCRLLTSRARFSPALDRKGRPTADSFDGRIVWRLPQPEPEPEPEPPPTPTGQG